MAKVLLVEDDNNLREIFEMRLQAEGYTTSVANDGEEALVVALKERPDLIIADVMMPKMSGFEMLETLRSTPDMNNVKVIMMTALGQAEDRERGEKLGVVKYLVKSQVTLEDFVRSVKEVLPVGSSGAQNPQPSGQVSQVSNNNNVESERKMDDNNNQPSGGDAGNNPISGTPAGDGGAGDGQMSTAQQQDAVNQQVNDAMGGDSGSGDSGASGDAGMGTPPADGGAGDSGAPAAPAGGDQSGGSQDNSGGSAPGGM